MAKDLKEQIEIMTHYLNGGEIEFKRKIEHAIMWEKLLTDPEWNWDVFDYRIKEPKQKVNIEKWLCEYVGCEELKGSKRFFIIEKVVPFEVAGKKLKLIETYEVEL